MAQPNKLARREPAPPNRWHTSLQWDVIESPTLGLFCILLGASAAWIARGYDNGTLIEMGPGFVPTAIALALLFFGVVILLMRGRDLRPAAKKAASPETASESDDVGERRKALKVIGRVMFFILGSIILFGLTLRPLGLLASTFLLVTSCSFAQRETRILSVLILAAVITLAASLLFVGILGMEVPLLPRALRDA